MIFKSIPVEAISLTDIVTIAHKENPNYGNIDVQIHYLFGKVENARN